MPTTIITAIDALKLALKDRNAQFLSDAEYERFALAHTEPEASWQLQRLCDGYWVSTAAPLCLLQPTFTEEPGCDYTLSCGSGGLYGAVSIKRSAGSDDRPSIAVMGCRLDFNRCLEELLVFIATYRAQEYSQSIHGSSVSPQTAREELLRQAEVLRGVRAV